MFRTSGRALLVATLAGTALVAAGLLAFAVHTAHEGGWINILLERAVDLRWLIEPGSVQSALITGMFGIQPEPTVGEVLVWFAYAIPMTIYVLRPQRRPTPVAAPPAVSSHAVESV